MYVYLHHLYLLVSIRQWRERLIALCVSSLWNEASSWLCSYLQAYVFADHVDYCPSWMSDQLIDNLGSLSEGLKSSHTPVLSLARHWDRCVVKHLHTSSDYLMMRQIGIVSAGGYLTVVGLSSGAVKLCVSVHVSCLRVCWGWWVRVSHPHISFEHDWMDNHWSFGVRTRDSGCRGWSLNRWLQKRVHMLCNSCLLISLTAGCPDWLCKL